MKGVDPNLIALQKCPSGIAGLDEITGGGLPRGRPTLVCGGAGCGKTLFSIEFLVKGILKHNEPGVFMAFEETERELASNVCSLGFNLYGLAEEKKLSLDYVHVERSEIEETGEYDLDGLFIRLGLAIDSIGAKRVVLDTLESLFSGLSNQTILRAELRRLFRWLKDKGVTAIITAERGEGSLTRHGLEEYVSDCVILLDHRLSDQVATRRIRIVKYRGSMHGTNEYPFLISEEGIEILPITSVGIDYAASTERVRTGLERLDTMLGGEGLYRGSSVLISGTAGTGKSSLAATIISASCDRGENAIYFALEESQSQILRNMRSIGIDLERHVKCGCLHFKLARPTSQGLETHLAAMYKIIHDRRPRMVVVDPVTNFLVVGAYGDVKSVLTRLLDLLKTNQITTIFTSLTSPGASIEQTDAGVSSLIDTWLLLRDVEVNGERNRVLYLLKSRGMAHSNQIREFLLTNDGIKLVDVNRGPDGVLTGSARIAYEARERAQELQRRQELARRKRELDRKRQVVEAQIAAMRADLATAEAELEATLAEAEGSEAQVQRDRMEMVRYRKGDFDGARGEGN